MDNIQICPPRPAQYSVAKFLPYLEGFQSEKSKEIGEKADLFKKIMINEYHLLLSPKKSIKSTIYNIAYLLIILFVKYKIQFTIRL